MSYNPNSTQFVTFDNLLVDQIAVLKDQVKQQLLQQAVAVGQITNPIIRPLRAADLNTTYHDIFDGFVMDATANTASALTSSGFSTATGKAYAFYGFADTTSTKSVTGLQFILNGHDFPIKPAVVTDTWTGTEAKVYHSPIYAVNPNQALEIDVYGNSAGATVTVRILGYIAESGSQR